MAIEITPRPKIKASLWAIILWSFCLVLLIVFIASYVYFEKESEKMVEDLKITASEKALAQEIEKKSQELLLYQKKINDFGTLVSEHRKTENIFEFLERTTLPNVWFSDFNFDSSKNTVELSGQAESFVALGQQLRVLKKEKFLKNINLSKVSIGKEGEIDFSLHLTFGNQLYK